MLKTLLLAFLTLTTLMADKEVVVTTTIHKSDYEDKSMPNLKKQLMIQAKLEAASQLFGEIITSQTLVKDGSLLKDLITAEKGGIVHIKGNPEFGNGEGLGELQVKATAYATDKDMEDMTVHKIELKGFVYTNPKLTLAQLKEEAQKAFLVEAVGQKKPSIKTQANAAELAKELVVSTKIEKMDFNSDWMAYKMSGYVEYIPVFLKSESVSKKSNSLETIKNKASMRIFSGGKFYKSFIIDTSAKGLNITKKVLESIKSEAKNKVYANISAKLLIPDSVKTDKVMIRANNKTSLNYNGGAWFKAYVNGTLIEGSEEAEIAVIHDGDLRYVKLNVQTYLGTERYYQEFLLVLQGMGILNYVVISQDDEKVYELVVQKKNK